MIKLAYDTKVKNTKLNKLLSKHMTEDNLNSEYLAAILRVSDDAHDSEIVKYGKHEYKEVSLKKYQGDELD